MEKYQLQIISIITDDEKSFVKAVKKTFTNIIHINCYFHYKKDLNEYFKSLGYTKKKDKILYNKSKQVISILGKIPLEYNSHIAYVDTILDNLQRFQMLLKII